MANIWYERQQYVLPGGEHVGENLRAFFGVKQGKDLYRQTDQGDDVLIEPKTSYFVYERDKFYSVSQKINES